MNVILIFFTACIFATTLYPLEDISAEQLVIQYAWQIPHINPKRVMIAETPPWYYFRNSARTEYTQQKQLRNAVTNYICDTKDTLLEYAKNTSVQLLKHETNIVFINTSADLVKALHETMLNPHKTITRVYNIHCFNSASLKKNHPTFNLQKFENYEGTPLQHIIHTKNHNLLAYLQKVKTDCTICTTGEFLIFEEGILHLIVSSEAYNEAGNFFLAFYITNIIATLMAPLHNKALSDSTHSAGAIIFQWFFLRILSEISPKNTQFAEYAQKCIDTSIQTTWPSLARYITTLQLPSPSEMENEGERLRLQKELQGARHFAKGITVIFNHAL